MVAIWEKVSLRHFLFGLSGIVLWLTGCQVTVVATPTQLPPRPNDIEAVQVSSLPVLDPDEITLGETVYAANCANCHGVNLEGEADWKIQNEDQSFRSPPHDDTGHTWHHPDDQLIEAITLGGARFEGLNIGGTSDMPAFGEIMTDAEITAVLTYIKSSWPDDIRAIQWQMSVQTQE
jgi:mono/diheme cytochrome c family protein